MSRPTYSTQLDTIIAGGQLGLAFRVLTVAPAWPAGDPPFASGHVTFPAMTAPFAAYDEATFDPAVWTDITALVSEYHVTQDAGMAVDQCSLSMPAAWTSTALAAVFREMRAIVIQERYSGAGITTAWVTRFWGLSDGFSEFWDGPLHRYTVNAKDALKLANLDLLGAADGAAVYQADLVEIGSITTHYTMQLVADATDAWEFGVTEDGEDDGPIQPNWADKPGPQFWCHNVPGTTEPVKLAVGGDAVQAVFGEGVVRVGKAWAQTDPGSPVDYSKGLGFGAEDTPDIRGYLFRFAHPVTADRDGTPLTSDLAEGITQENELETPGEALVNGNLTALPEKLTLVQLDGAGTRHATTGMTYDAEYDYTTITLANASAVVPFGTPLRYGEANRATDRVQRLLLECGYQVSESDKPLYIGTLETPEILGAARDLVLPPLVYQDTDGVTALGALDDLRHRGYLPPNWIPRATPAGHIVAGSVEQLVDGEVPNPDIIPLVALPASPGIAIDRGDLTVATRVIARGLARQVTDETQTNALPIADVTFGDGGLPSVPTPPYSGSSGQAVRTSPPGANNYQFVLAWLFDRTRSVSLAATTRRPWAWFHQCAYLNGTMLAALRAYYHTLVNAWTGKLLAEIVFPSEITVSTLELDAQNTWATDTSDWGTIYHNSAPEGDYLPHADPQTIAVEYRTEDDAAWKPLVSNLLCPVAADSSAVLKIEAKDFDSRAAVRASRLRIRCIAPFAAECGYGAGSFKTYITVVGVWLTALKVWTDGEIRGVAELGNAGNYGGELVSEPWPTIRTRLRRRTYIVPDAVPWITTEEEAKWLALEWLKEKTRDLAPRKVAAIRPDARLWDTVRLTLPNGQTSTALVVATDHTHTGVASLTLVDYHAPYAEEEW